MSGVWKWILIVLAVLYFLSPIDLLPDILHPLFGRLDDILLFLGLILYYYYGINVLKWLRARDTHHPKNNRNIDDETDNRKVGEDRTDLNPNPRQILGVPLDAQPEEIKKAYRDASQKYHPDKVSHLGPELQELAQKKFVEIQKAYEELRRQGGW